MQMIHRFTKLSLPNALKFFKDFNLKEVCTGSIKVNVKSLM